MTHSLALRCQNCAASALVAGSAVDPTTRWLDPQQEDDWQQLLRLLPADLAASAQATHALQRRHAIRSAADLLRLVLVYVLWDWSLALVGAWATTIGLAALSDVAVLRRLQQCQGWLQQLLTQMLAPLPLKDGLVGVRLRVLDASVVSKPGSTGTDWRLHLLWDVAQASISGVELTDATGGETLARVAPDPATITLGDRGYAHPRGMGLHLAAGGWLVVRFHFQNLPVEDAQGHPIAVVPWLRALPSPEAERAAWVRTPQGVFPLRLIARRLSAPVAEAARRRLRQQARKKHRTPDAASLEAAGYLTLLSNLPTSWEAELILQVYRFRWQIELVFKRLKGLIALDALRARAPALGQVYLLGKLVAALLIERTCPADVRVRQAWWADQERPISLWRWFAWCTESVRVAVRGPLPLARLLDALPLRLAPAPSSTSRLRSSLAPNRPAHSQ